MTNQSTPVNGGATERALYDAYLAGLAHGIARGALMMMLPAEKNAGEFRKREIARRKSEYAHNAAVLQKGRKYMKYWPKIMPGGWPIPPTVPDPDESTYWPEIDGWPCPPPHLRGQNLAADSGTQP